MSRKGRTARVQGGKGDGTPATVALRAAGVPFVEHYYAHDPRASSYGLEAAAALGVETGIVYKTLLVQADGTLGVVIVPVDRQVDLKAAAASFGAKRATMAEPAVAERSSGYVVGGISPFGQRRRLSTVLDERALGHPQIYVSGGRRGFSLAVAVPDVVRLLDAGVAAIAK